MRLVVQCVSKADIRIEGKLHAKINKGLLVLIGIEHDDEEQDSIYLAHKLCKLRIFADSDGKMNLDLLQAEGDLLIVSQFTLYASTKKGNRPSYIRAARPEKAIPLYEHFMAQCSSITGKVCKSGVFGADMQVELVNEGPVTIIVDSKSRE